MATIKENPIQIDKQLYDIKNGISLIKTIYGNAYDKIPKGLQHPDIKNEWDAYKGVDFKLYQMTKSHDPEVLKVALEILRSKKIPFKWYGWVDETTKKIEGGFHIDLFENDNSSYYKSPKELWNKLD